MAEQIKKQQSPKKPAMPPKPGAPTTGSGCGPAPAQKPASPKPGEK